MKIGVLGGHRPRLGVREVLDTLIGLEVVLDPETLAPSVNPHEGVRAVTIHVPKGSRCTSIRHEDRYLVGALGRQGPEIPLSVVICSTCICPTFLRVDEVRELRGVYDEKHRGVIADEDVVALVRVELQSEAAG